MNGGERLHPQHRNATLPPRGGLPLLRPQWRGRCAAALRARPTLYKDECISDQKEREDLVGSCMHVAVAVTPVKQTTIRGGGAGGGCQP